MTPRCQSCTSMVTGTPAAPLHRRLRPSSRLVALDPTSEGRIAWFTCADCKTDWGVEYDKQGVIVGWFASRA